MENSKRSKGSVKDVAEDIFKENAEIFKLNDDCMRHIFSFLSIKERIKVTRVCKKWQTFVKLPWCDIKELKISYVRNMDQHKIQYTVPILKQVLGYCGKSLTSLTLGGWKEKGFNKQVITIITKTCPNLRCLNLEGMQLTYKAAEVLADSYNKLTDIALGPCDSNCTEAISQLFLANKQLKSVQFDWCFRLGSECLSKLPAESVESLTFGKECKFPRKDILDVIGNFTQLKALKMNRNDNLCIAVHTLLQKLPNKLILESLALNEENPPSRTLELKNICYFTNLRKITLGSYAVHDEIVTAIGQNCKRLSYVNLSWSHFLTDVGLKNLVNTLCIEELHLSGLNKISNECFTHINLSSLKHFSCYWFDQWTNKCFRLLMLASPNLRRLEVKSCPYVDPLILTNDALHYTSNRSSEAILNLRIANFNLVPKLRKISSRLTVELGLC